MYTVTVLFASAVPEIGGLVLFVDDPFAGRLTTGAAGGTDGPSVLMRDRAKRSRPAVYPRARLTRAERRQLAFEKDLVAEYVRTREELDAWLKDASETLGKVMRRLAE